MSLCPTLVTGGTRALGKVLFPRCLLEWKVPEETPKACVPFFFLPYPIPWTNHNSCNTSLGRVLSSIGGTTQRKEAGGGNPITRRHGAHGAFQSSSCPEAPHPLGAVGLVSLQEDLSGSGGCGTMWRGAGSPGPWGRAHWLAHLPQLRQPHDSPSLGNKLPRSPRPEGNRVKILFIISILYWCW